MSHVGDQLRWDGSEVNEILPSKGSTRRKSSGGGPFKVLDHQEPGRVREGPSGSSAEEDADDIFESEFMMLKDIWKFDDVPFPVTKQVRTCSVSVFY